MRQLEGVRHVVTAQRRAMPRYMKCAVVSIVVSSLWLAVRHRGTIMGDYHQQLPSPSIHTVRPADIGLVAALGDSFTAGFRAIFTNTSTTYGDNPEYSFSMGAKRNHITIPNILRMFGASPIGASNNETDRGFNCAVSGDRLAADVLLQSRRGNETLKIEQRGSMLKVSRYIIQKAKSDKWKLLTVFIGLNDMSRVCFDGESIEVVANEYKNSLERALEAIARSMSRTIVSIVSVPDVRTVRLLGLKRPKCSEEESRRLGRALTAQIEAIVAGGRLERDDFTLVQQPLFSGATKLPKLRSGAPDATVFSADNFHPSVKGHAMYAAALWNNMFEPVGAKSSRYLERPFHIRIPSKECPYIRTSKNSVSCYTSEVRDGDGFIDVGSLFQ